MAVRSRQSPSRPTVRLWRQRHTTGLSGSGMRPQARYSRRSRCIATLQYCHSHRTATVSRDEYDYISYPPTIREKFDVSGNKVDITTRKSPSGQAIETNHVSDSIFWMANVAN